MSPSCNFRATPLVAVALAGLSLLAAACASTGAVPRPFPLPAGSAASPPPATTPPRDVVGTPADGYTIAGTALALRGAPYRNGGADPTGFDCSGFTQYVFGQHGVTLPRGVMEQFRSGKAVSPDTLAAGDLIFFRTLAVGPSHVAIAIGGDEFVHAPSTSGVVRVEHLSASYWSQRFMGARRVN
jgi:cell wall-associated NlpC family hydrolase